MIFVWTDAQTAKIKQRIRFVGSQVRRSQRHNHSVDGIWPRIDNVAVSTTCDILCGCSTVLVGGNDTMTCHMPYVYVVFQEAVIVSVR
jgi:hypothetical protein